jgi:hypothetical protein
MINSSVENCLAGGSLYIPCPKFLNVDLEFGMC